MYRRSFMLMTVIVIMTTACGSINAGETAQPTATVAPLATETPVPLVPTATPTLITQPDLPTEWFNKLEVIQAANWSRVQLLEVIPAEIPLVHSAVAFSLDGKIMAMGSSSGAEIYFWDVQSGNLIQKVAVNGVSDPGSYFDTIEYLPDGTLIANTMSPYETYHLDMAGNILSMWYGDTFALSLDRSIMAHINTEGIVLIDIASNTPLLSIKDASGFDLSLSPDSAKIAAENVGVDYIRTEIWDVPSRTLLTALDETAAPRYSPDGSFLAATYYDHTNDKTPMKIFSPDGMTEIATLNVNEPNDLINSAAVWTVDGSVIVAQVVDGSSTAWDASTWHQLETPTINGLVYSFSPNGRILITRTADGSILLWGVLP